MIPVINFDTRQQSSQRQVEMYSSILRCGIFGPSGIGKSNVLLTILLHMKPFWNIYLCSKTLYQDKYKMFKELIDSYSEKHKKKEKISSS